MVRKIREIIELNYDARDYPVLGWQGCMWSAERPLEGLTILDTTPVFRNTLAKYIPLIEGGAVLSIGISKVMPRDEKVVELLRGMGIGIITPDDTDRQFDIILDCAAAFSKLDARIGYVELTRSGVESYATCNRPVYVADSSRIKRIETSLGTGESYFRAMETLGYGDWSGRNLVIFGRGKVGRGLESYGVQKGACVLTFDENSSAEEVCRAIGEAYAVVTATGVKGALAAYARQLTESGALLANMGVDDEFSESVPVERVLAQKRPLNFILEEPTHLRFIEATMALHNQGAVELLSAGGRGGLIEPSAQTERELFEIVERQGHIPTEMLERVFVGS